MQIGGIQGGSATAVTQSKSVTYYDPKDTNQDGVVSFAEELAYSLQQVDTPSSSAASNPSLSQYGQSGALNMAGLTKASSVDTYA